MLLEGGVFPCTLADVLIFWTGASSPPPLGFEVPSIDDDRQPPGRPLVVTFYNESGRLPYASTCGLQLWLPTGLKPDEFRDILIRAFKEGTEFGFR